MVLDQYQGACPALLDHLADTNKLMENEDSEKQTVVMEVVNFSYLLNGENVTLAVSSLPKFCFSSLLKFINCLGLF